MCTQLYIIQNGVVQIKTCTCRRDSRKTNRNKHMPFLVILILNWFLFMKWCYNYSTRCLVKYPLIIFFYYTASLLKAIIQHISWIIWYSYYTSGFKSWKHQKISPFIDGGGGSGWCPPPLLWAIRCFKNFNAYLKATFPSIIILHKCFRNPIFKRLSYILTVIYFL